jgi:hypothetical protein
VPDPRVERYAALLLDTCLRVEPRSRARSGVEAPIRFLRSGGRIELDDRTVQQNGAWTV